MLFRSAVDSVLILGKEHRKGRKDHESDNKFLWGRGRDLEEFSVSVKQNEKGRWDVLGLTREAQPTEERTDIISVLASFEEMSISEIAKACHSDYDNVKNLLSKLHAEGQVERVRRGIYRLAGSQDKMPF